MASILNGNVESPPQLDADVIKVVVIGEPKCGKSTFIQAYYSRHFPGDLYSHNGVRVYPCEFEANNQMRRLAIFEILSDPDFFPELRIPHYEEANIIVFMYAIDDPPSFQMLTEKWIPETTNAITLHKIPVVFVGTKADLRNNQQVIDRLALQNQRPLTFQQGLELLGFVPGYRCLMECSANYLNEIDQTFNTMFDLFLLSEDNM